MERGVRILTDTGDAAILADPLLDRGLHYLFLDALCQGAKVTEVRISLILTGANGILILESDGDGFPAEEKARLFDRGYGRTGSWGLFLTREILAVTGMAITESGDSDRGQRFEITLPPGTLQLNVGEPSDL
jgi:sensor histidine kinase regulating citrate/malate metabolism